MDIVSRIKIFLNEKNITVSQFADGCEISRPTVSQLLNGRNKKVSDEIIAKVHKAYPALSVAWLMFGEGEMYVDGFADSVKKSQPAENSIFEIGSNEDIEFENVVQHVDIAKTSILDPQISAPSARYVESVKSQVATTPSVDAKASVAQRSVTKIIVYYSDNSFEEFVPR